MYVAGLEASAEVLVAKGIRKSTANSYSTAQRQFIAFCNALQLTPVPTSEKTLLLYITYLQQKGVSFNAINVYVSAVRNINIINGHDLPNFRSGRVKLALRAVQAAAPPPAQKSPITFIKLQQMWPVIKLTSNTHMWQALVALAFFASLRCSEYTPSVSAPGPSLACVSFSGDGKVLRYKVLQSKTKARGFTSNLACSGNEICARCCMEKYIKLRSATSQCTSSDPLFTIQGTQVTARQVNLFIKQTVTSLGWPPQSYSAHSLRAGATTTAATVGFNDWELTKLGGWTSSAYNIYIRDNKINTVNFSRRMARGTTE